MADPLYVDHEKEKCAEGRVVKWVLATLLTSALAVNIGMARMDRRAYNASGGMVPGIHPHQSAR